MLSALVVVILGVWMVMSPLMLHWAAAASWNSWIVGVLAAICGTRVQRDDKVWQAILTYIASACIFVAGFIPRLQHPDELIGRSIIFGALLFIAGVSSFGHRYHDHAESRAH
jgi:predicted membrane channel-forming protein YqfA (hemolysin III family)